VSSAIHWADRIAAELPVAGRPHVISTGISPSGEIHVGNMREVLTADAVFRALAGRGVPARLNYVADNFDPLRRVYPFLRPDVYAPHVGRPLSEIPCPCGGHPSYGEHFLQPFLGALETLRIHVEVERADRMYKSGRMDPYVVRALERRDRIAAILHELTGKSTTTEWSPFTPLCPACGRLTGTRLRGFSAADRTIDYECECGSHGTLPMAGGGKLVWRVDWPARWTLLGVTVEPFGKDHATRGGSYDTGVRIAREVFDAEPPHPIPYEWIRLKGRGDMSSSRGNVLAIWQMLEAVPPEALRYLVLRERPQRTIDFDPGLPLLQLVDEIDGAAAAGGDERALELSRAGEFEPVGVPFKHLVVVAQATAFDPRRVMEVLARTGYASVSPAAVARRLGYARRWLEQFAPDEVRFTVREDLPAQAAELTDDQRSFLGRLAQELEGEGERGGDDLGGQAIHERIYALAGQFPSTPAAELFRAIYLVLLGKPRGPRAGAFIAVLGGGFCARRFREAAAARSS
jgi:lysyl-tRNA synthetase class 1